MSKLNLCSAAQGRLRVLVKLPNYVGDVVSSLPSLHAIRQAFPKGAHRVDLLTTPMHRDLLYEHEGAFDAIHAPAWDIHRVKPWTVCSFLKRQHYDVVVSLSRQSRFYMGFRLAGIPHRVAYRSSPLSWTLTNCEVPEPKGEDSATGSQRRYYLALVKHGINPDLDIDAADHGIALKPDPEYEGQILGIIQRNLFDDAQAVAQHGDSWTLDREYYVIVPGAARTVKGGLKQWPLWNFAQVASKLHTVPEGKDLIPVFAFGPDDQELYEEFQSRYLNKNVLPGLTVVFPPGVTRLGHMMAAIAHKKCRFVLSNDTGPRHITVALEKQVVSVFGPTGLNRATYSSSREFPVWVNVGCNLSECRTRKCREDHICMTAVTPRLVLSKIMGFIFSRSDFTELC